MTIEVEQVAVQQKLLVVDRSFAVCKLPAGTASPAWATGCVWGRTMRSLTRSRGRSLPMVSSEEGKIRMVELIPYLRCVFGNPFRRVTFSPDWRTDTALSLAR